MKYLLLLLLVSCTQPSVKVTTRHNIPGQDRDKQLIVVVIDSGFGFNDIRDSAHLCRFGHKDFTTQQEYYNRENQGNVPKDNDGHGTHIVGLINKYAQGTKINYCIIMLKFWDSDHNYTDNGRATTSAIKYATSIGAKIINYSGGGKEYNHDEAEAVRAFLNTGGIFITSAGNNGANLDIPGNSYYPALVDPRIIVVGNMNSSNIKAKSSNYGKDVRYWEVGEKVESYGMTMSGTSMSTAIKTGKIIRDLRK